VNGWLSIPLGFLGWIYLICRFEGYFHLGAEIAYNGDTEALIRQLDAWPMDQPLPIVLYRKFTNTCSPPFRWGLVKAKRDGNGWGVFPIFMESNLTADLLNESPVLRRRFYAWAPEDIGHLKVLEEAFQLSDRLTRWLRGDVGWTAGVKPYVNLCDFMVGFQPRWRRKPLTPQKLRGG
jgi:hypothetical protein